MKNAKKALAVLFTVVMLTGCGFEEIKTDKDIVTKETSVTTTAQLTLEVPTVTTKPAESGSDGSQTSEPDVNSDSPYPLQMIATANVNARKEPSTAGEIFKIVSEGTEVKVIDYIDGWYKVEVDSTEVYIIENYLEKVKVEEKPEEEKNEEEA